MPCFVFPSFFLSFFLGLSFSHKQSLPLSLFIPIPVWGRLRGRSNRTFDFRRGVCREGEELRGGESQMPEEDLIELKFRLYDGTDIGPFHYSPTSTVALLKDRILADWPKDKKIAPKTANDIKLINAGKILENSKTVGQCRAPFGELQKAVITMHVVVQPSLAKAKTEKKVDEIPRKHICSCTIM